ncbi:MAG: S-adenosyl-l-methionine hydroxide adenosyltransferase family protein [Anaerolineales bacterium]
MGPLEFALLVAGPSIALLTDFGTQGIYVGVLKGVLSTLSPHANLIDISHDVPRGNIQAGAFMLWQASPYMPPNTTYLCVVDPGVGSARRGVAAEWSTQICVGPDNGLFSYLVSRDGTPEVIELWDPQVSSTFHGRDIFAPAAAHLASGAALDDLGPPVELEVLLPEPRLEAPNSGLVEGEVIHQDPFGNLITSIGVLHPEGSQMRLAPWLGQMPESHFPAQNLAAKLLSGVELPLVRTFDDVPEGEGLAYIGSSGLLEIGVNRGSAAHTLDLKPGQSVQLLDKG